MSTTATTVYRDIPICIYAYIYINTIQYIYIYIHTHVCRLLTVLCNYLTFPETPLPPSSPIFFRYSFLWHAVPNFDSDRERTELQKQRQRVAWCHLGTAERYNTYQPNFSGARCSFFFLAKKWGSQDWSHLRGLGLEK